MTTAFTIDGTNWAQQDKIEELVRAVSERNEAVGGAAIDWDVGSFDWVPGIAAVSVDDDIQHANFFNYFDTWIETNYGKFIDVSDSDGTDFDGATEIKVYSSMDALCSAAGLTNQASLKHWKMVAGDDVAAEWFDERKALLSALRAMPMYKNGVTTDPPAPKTDGGHSVVSTGGDSGGGSHLDAPVHDTYNGGSQRAGLAAIIPSDSTELPYARTNHPNSVCYLYMGKSSCTFEYFIPAYFSTLAVDAEIYLKAVAQDFQWMEHNSGLTQDVYNLIHTDAAPTKGTVQETSELFITSIDDLESFPIGGDLDTGGSGWKVAATDGIIGVIKIDFAFGIGWL